MRGLSGKGAARGVRRRLPLGRGWTLAAAAALVVVIGLVVLWQAEARARRERIRRRAAQLVADYSRAWEASNWSAMAALVVAPPPDVAAANAAAFQALAVDGATMTPGRAVVSGSRASAPFSALLRLRGLGEWRYDGRLSLVRQGGQGDGGRWRVAWTPAAIHPALCPGLHLERSRARPPRAPVLGSDGTRLGVPPAGLAADLVGRVGPATAERARGLGLEYQQGDVVGLSGLERALEARLAGRPSGQVRVVDSSGRLVRVLQVFPGEVAQSVRTTIDPRVQAAAERALAGVAQPAALVALDPPTAQMRAVVSRPVGGFPRALAGRYPPGSTFKIITATAALAAGVGPDDLVSCPPQVSVQGKVFRNAEGEQLGPIPFRQAFAHSCNTAFINLASRLSDEQLLAAARLYGFGTELSLPLTTFGGRFPPPASPVEHVADAIGQGKVEASPLQMATVAAAVAAGGWHPPGLIVDQPADLPQGARAAPPPPVTAPAPGPVPPLDPKVDAVLQQLMRLVVTEGTGTAANLPGIPVAGKTGTAEFGTGNPPATHAWFVGFGKSLAFAVLVEGGGFGGKVAAPIAAKFLSSP